eukprot:3228866-Prymnesium_polylepis.1
MRSEANLKCASAHVGSIVRQVGADDRHVREAAYEDRPTRSRVAVSHTAVDERQTRPIDANRTRGMAAQGGSHEDNVAAQNEQCPLHTRRIEAPACTPPVAGALLVIRLD